VGTLDDLVREGKVRYVGASNFAAWQLAKALGVAAIHSWEPFASLQPTYSLITRDIERELLPLCRSEGLAVIPYGPLAGGVLTGKYAAGQEPPAGTRAAGGEAAARGMSLGMNRRGFAIVEALRAVAEKAGKTPAQVALKWVATREGVTAPILGARSVAQLGDNLGVLGWNLDPELEAELDSASRIHLGYPHDFHTWMDQIGF
jgi:aryl-alcohol dehydrogenase-like predicted oxidoreductase